MSVRMKMKQIEKLFENLLCFLFFFSCITRNVDLYPGEERVFHCLFWQYPHCVIEDKHLVQQIQSLFRPTVHQFRVQAGVLRVLQ